MFRALFFLFLIFLASCSDRFSYYYPHFYTEELYAEDLSRAFDEVAERLCSRTVHLCTTPLLVTDFVDVDTLRPGPAGRLFSEYLKASLSKICGCEIFEVELRKTFRLTEEGVVPLSRSVSELRSTEFKARWAVVGTYSEGREFTTVFVRLVDLADGRVKVFVSKRFRRIRVRLN